MITLLKRCCLQINGEKYFSNIYQTVFFFVSVLLANQTRVCKNRNKTASLNWWLCPAESSVLKLTLLSIPVLLLFWENVLMLFGEKKRENWIIGMQWIIFLIIMQHLWLCFIFYWRFHMRISFKTVSFSLRCFNSLANIDWFTISLSFIPEITTF